MDLIDAAENGNIQRVRELLKNGVDVNFRDENGETALYKVSQMRWGNEDVKMVRLYYLE